MLLIAACKQTQPVFNVRFSAFGVQVDLSIVGVERDRAQRAAEALAKDFAYLDQEWHERGADTLARVNRLLATSKPFAAPPAILPLIGLARQFAISSHGLIEPAAGKLMELWGFHADPVERHPPPLAGAIAALVRAKPRMQDLELKGILLRSRNPQVQLDFAALIKGYSIDLAIARLREMGIDNALVKVGGDLRVIGDRDGQPWRIPIQRPAGGGVLAIIELSGDESLFTAGIRGRSFLYEGKSYHDIIDPRTGYPAEGAREATVLHVNGVTADAAAHALFVAGPEDWIQIAKDMGIRYVLLMDDAGTLHMTPAMAKRVKILDKEADIQLSKPL
jgi:thiamine biosynthesis lipoprotein